MGDQLTQTGPRWADWRGAQTSKSPNIWIYQPHTYFKIICRMNHDHWWSLISWIYWLKVSLINACLHHSSSRCSTGTWRRHTFARVSSGSDAYGSEVDKTSINVQLQQCSKVLGIDVYGFNSVQWSWFLTSEGPTAITMLIMLLHVCIYNTKHNGIYRYIKKTSMIYSKVIFA